MKFWMFEGGAARELASKHRVSLFGTPASQSRALPSGRLGTLRHRAFLSILFYILTEMSRYEQCRKFASDDLSF